MGEIVNVHCKACNREWRCMEGSGLLYGKKENMIEAFSEKERAEVTARMEKSEIPIYDFTFRLAVCNHCHNVVSVPALTVGDEETYVGTCPACGKKVKKPVPALKGTVCPACKSKALKAETVGYWD